MVTTIVRFFLKLWLKVPFGYICRVHHKDSYMTLRKDYWIIVTHGNTTDALPITFVSHHLQHEFALRMKAIGYDVDQYFDKNAHANVTPISEIHLHDLVGRVEPVLVEDSEIAGLNEKR